MITIRPGGIRSKNRSNRSLKNRSQDKALSTNHSKPRLLAHNYRNLLGSRRHEADTATSDTAGSTPQLSPVAQRSLALTVIIWVAWHSIVADDWHCLADFVVLCFV